MVAEGRFRRLKAPELIEDIYLGAQYADESPLNQRLRRSPPDVVYTPIDVTSTPSRQAVTSRQRPKATFIRSAAQLKRFSAS